MKLTSALCALILVISVTAVALPNAQPIAVAVAEPKCGERGQPCGKVKREPSPDALTKCGERGQPCGKVKRAAEAFAGALAEPSAEPQSECAAARNARRLTRALASLVAETQDNPEAYFDSLGASENDEDTEISKRDALAECGEVSAMWESQTRRQSRGRGGMWRENSALQQAETCLRGRRGSCCNGRPEAACWERG